MLGKLRGCLHFGASGYSLYGVSADQAVTVPLTKWVPFVVPCTSRVVARGYQPSGSERLLSSFPGLGLAPFVT